MVLSRGFDMQSIEVIYWLHANETVHDRVTGGNLGRTGQAGKEQGARSGGPDPDDYYRATKEGSRGFGAGRSGMKFLRGLWRGWSEFWAMSWWGKGPVLAILAFLLISAIGSAPGGGRKGWWAVGRGRRPGDRGEDSEG